jgi:hypothetical protein
LRHSPAVNALKKKESQYPEKRYAQNGKVYCKTAPDADTRPAGYLAGRLILIDITPATPG